MLERDYSHIEEVKHINYTQGRNAHRAVGIGNVKRFISALEDIGKPIFKIRTSRFPLSEADVKDEWMDLRQNGWSIGKAWDSSVSGFNEVYICKKIDQ